MIFQSFNFQAILSFDDFKGVGNWIGENKRNRNLKSEYHLRYYLRYNFLMRACIYIIIFVSISSLFERKKGKKTEQGNQNRDSQINDEDVKDLYERIVGRMIDFSRCSIVPVAIPLFLLFIYLFFMLFVFAIEHRNIRLVPDVPLQFIKEKKKKERETDRGYARP